MPTAQAIRSPTLSEIINRGTAALSARLRVSMPGQVVTYYPATQTADVLPLINDTIVNADATTSSEPLPVVPSVPVLFPGGGGFRATYPIQAGDQVELIFADRSLEKWQTNGMQVDPVDLRQHDLTDAICIPGLHANNSPWTGASTTGATWGKDGGPQITATASDIEVGGNTDFLIKGSTQDAALRSFMIALNAFALALAVAVPAAGAACTALETAITVFTSGAYLSTVAKVG